jgi:hypothetical protein
LKKPGENKKTTRASLRERAGSPGSANSGRHQGMQRSLSGGSGNNGNNGNINGSNRNSGNSGNYSSSGGNTSSGNINSGTAGHTNHANQILAGAVVTQSADGGERSTSTSANNPRTTNILNGETHWVPTFTYPPAAGRTGENGDVSPSGSVGSGRNGENGENNSSRENGENHNINHNSNTQGPGERSGGRSGGTSPANGNTQNNFPSQNNPTGHSGNQNNGTNPNLNHQVHLTQTIVNQNELHRTTSQNSDSGRFSPPDRVLQGLPTNIASLLSLNGGMKLGQ